MSDEYQAMVRDFHIGIGQKQDVELRIRLIEEEAGEFIDAVDETNVVEAIDALCDLLYVTYGSADVFDISLDASADAALPAAKVENINWTKLGQELRAFNISIEDAVKALRVFQQFNAKGKLKARLYEIVRGCWRCASQALGVDLRPFFLEVHRTNMHKLEGPKREDGKQLKPPGWKPPRLAAMYDRLKSGMVPHCEDSCDAKHLKQYRAEPCLDGGGSWCLDCGGFIVEVGS